MTKRVGVSIRRLRETRGLTQAALARKAKLGWITVQRVEAGTQDPTLGTLALIARALKVRVRDLLPKELRRRGR